MRQRGTQKETSFAVCRVKNLWVWDGQFNGNAVDVTGLSRNAIAEKEGYQHWGRFHVSYMNLNIHNWDDPNRTHYFIEFEIVEML